MKKFVNAMTMGMILVSESQNLNAMTEKAGSGNGAEVWKLVTDVCR